MRRQELRNWAAHELAIRAARTSISRLEGAGVRALPVKGVVLARENYDPAERPIADVDLLVSPADFRRALRVARQSGWRCIWDSRTLGNVNFIVDGVAIDVATSLGPTGISAIGTPALFQRATRSVDPLGFPHWRIEKHDHVLLLAMDAFKDKLGSGKPWAREDLVRVVSSTDFSPQVQVERAVAAGLQTMLALVADWVLSAGTVASWSTVREHLRSPRLRRMYIDRYRRLLQIEKSSKWRRWHISALTRMVSDSAPRRWLALALGAIGTARYLARHGDLTTNVWRDLHAPPR